jgi:chaperone modulatory protein CbpM
MITIDILVAQVSGLKRQDIEEWVSNDWVRPDGRAGDYAFHQIDVARVKLIHQLRMDMQVNDEALPIILSLLDQLYDQRRRLRELGETLIRITSPDIHQILVQNLLNKNDK